METLYRSRGRSGRSGSPSRTNSHSRGSSRSVSPFGRSSSVRSRPALVDTDSGRRVPADQRDLLGIASTRKPVASKAVTHRRPSSGR